MDALAHSWHTATQICVSPSEPSRTDTVQGQGGRGAGPLSGAILAQSGLVPRNDAPRDSPSLANSSEEGSPFSEKGHPLAPTCGPWTGRGGSRWTTSCGSEHHHFS